MLSLFLPLAIVIVAGLVTLSALSLHFFLLQAGWVIVGAGVVALFLVR